MTNLTTRFLAAGLIVLGGTGLATAQVDVDDERRVVGGVLVVEVDLNVTDLTEDVAGIILHCTVESMFEAYGVVGQGKAFLFDEGEYPEEAFYESGVAFLENLNLIPVDSVFGYGGIRSISQKVEVLLIDDQEPDRLESWVRGACVLQLVAKGWTFEADINDIEGDYPADCAAAPAGLFTCIRPGTTVQDATFTFERDFDAGSASTDDGN